MPGEFLTETLLQNSPTPRSVTLGADGYLWVTTDNQKLMRVKPDSPTEQDSHQTAGTLSAGILASPDGGKSLWYASPAHAQDYDPIYEWDVDKCTEINKYPLADDARAQTISWAVLTKKVSAQADSDGGEEGQLDPVLRAWTASPDGNGDLPEPIPYVFFAEPVHCQVGYVKVGESGPVNTHPLPRTADFDTWLWSVAVSVDRDTAKYTYWATGQKSTTTHFERSKNGLYTFTPGSGKEWRRIQLRDSEDQVPIHVITDSQYVWVGTRSPNKLCRYDIDNESWTESDTLDFEPRQLAFGPDGNIWVAAAGAIYCFKKDDKVSRVPSSYLPSGCGAEGLFVDAEKQQLWFTDPAKCSIGQYKITVDTNAKLTEITKGVLTTAGKSSPVAVPMIAQYTISDQPTPGIPITCIIEGGDTQFPGGGRSRVVHTNQWGTALFPKFTTGSTPGDLTLIMEYTAAEKSVDKKFTVTG
ncbi:hypothetical protein AB0D16_18605 [Streptomyces sp. NPDC048161]|uniref:hypothetical protein n=1 Tax=Streptomyces sp. NPDC048161 TaxID=3160985 RepID=UPI0033C2A482